MADDHWIDDDGIDPSIDSDEDCNLLYISEVVRATMPARESDEDR
jgi:hypothetical protein